MTPAEAAGIALAIVGPILVWLLADARGKGRSEALKERIESMDKRITENEKKATELSIAHAAAKAHDDSVTALLKQHFDADMQALARVEQALREVKSELMGAISELRADVRSSQRHEDTNPAIRGR